MIYLEDTRDEEMSIGYYSYSCITEGLTSMWQKRAFYRNVLSCYEQNALYEFIVNHTIEVNMERIYSHGRTLLKAEKYQIIYFTCGFIECLFEWIKGNLDYSIEELAEIEYSRFPSVRMQFYER